MKTTNKSLAGYYFSHLITTIKQGHTSCLLTTSNLQLISLLSNPEPPVKAEPLAGHRSGDPLPAGDRCPSG